MSPRYFLTFAAAMLLATTAPAPPKALADHLPPPVSVNIPGSFQTEIGCPGDWQADCATSMLAYDGVQDLWIGTFNIPAGNWEFKIAINGTWDENYGAGGIQNGGNISLILGSATAVTFRYNPHTHVVTTSVPLTVTAPGSFQSEIGCPGDWDPACLASQLFDPDNDQVYSFSTSFIPVGDYEFKIAIGLNWIENYGAGGVQGGPNIPFSVPVAGALVTFTWDAVTHVPTVTVDTATPAAPKSWGRIKTIYR